MALAVASSRWDASGPRASKCITSYLLLTMTVFLVERYAGLIQAIWSRS
jgi:hypothetical protein